MPDRHTDTSHGTCATQKATDKLNGTAAGPGADSGVGTGISGARNPAAAPSERANAQPQPQPPAVHALHALDTPPTTPGRFPDVCYQLRRKVLAFLDGDFHDDALLHAIQGQVRVAVDVIEQALQRYGLEQLSLSYNGGKDCLVLLILLLACLPTCPPPAPADASATKTTETPNQPSAATAPPPAGARAAPPPPPASSDPPPPIQAIYIVPPDPFPEVDAFVEASTLEYRLDLARYQMPMRAALDAYLDERPAVRGIFLGTRRTDPHGEFLEHFKPTDAGWPQIMRIHPVLDWRYVEIWGFIRHFDIPFCKLYNQGFTSLGGTTDTRPNPALARGDGDTTVFRPAYELQDDEEERLGRRR